MADWLLHCNPKVWDVWAWWDADEDRDLGTWTVSVHLETIAAGDRFAFWIDGKEAGVYAVGRIASGALFDDSSEYSEFWKQTPAGPVHYVELEAKEYLFDRPIRKAELAADSRFANALILRMPQSKNPVRLQPAEWQAIASRLGGGSSAKPAPIAKGVIVTERVLGTATEETTVTPSRVERVREYREAQLVKRYESSLRRQLFVRTARLPTGERLVVDAYDQADHRLIEAKASVSRQDVRMAIGQLLDYRRHIDRKAGLAVLLPEKPSVDLVELLHENGIDVIHETASGFARLAAHSVQRRADRRPSTARQK